MTIEEKTNYLEAALLRSAKRNREYPVQHMEAQQGKQKRYGVSIDRRSGSAAPGGKGKPTKHYRGAVLRPGVKPRNRSKQTAAEICS
jgi:hypothetical protein